MHSIFADEYLLDYYAGGFIDTGISVGDSLVEEMRLHYAKLEERRNDYPQYFTENEHQAYLSGKLIGALFNMFPQFAEKKLNKLYGDAYCKAVHAEQAFIATICKHLLEHGGQKFFKTRYMVASYDIYLNNDYRHRSFTDVHSDIPNFHHFYETENDVTIYLPLIDLNEANGGRLSILPEARSNLKIPGNVLLKLLEKTFLENRSYLDENGYIDPDKISKEDMKAFTKIPAYWELLETYKTNTDLATRYYMDAFIRPEWKAGQLFLFNNKIFHAAETWKNTLRNREIYMIRLLPVYDARIKLRGTIHGKPFNRYLLDLETGELLRFDHPVDFSQIPPEHKLKLSGPSSPGMAAQARG